MSDVINVTHILDYDHAKRQITDHTGAVITAEKAKQLLDDGLVLDSNLAFTRLAANDFDMDAVEADYQAEML